MKNPLQRYTFTSFQEPGADSPEKLFAANGEKKEPAKKTYSEEELEKAKADAFSEGKELGVNETKATIQNERLELDKKIPMLLADIGGSVSNIYSSFDKILAEKTTEVVKIIEAISKKIAGDALKEFPETKIEQVIKNCMQMLASDKEINIMVPEKILPVLQEKISAMGDAAGFQGKINLKADPALKESDCRIEWQNGKAEHNLEKLWQEVDKLLQNLSK